jgi:hypothetical protein
MGVRDRRASPEALALAGASALDPGSNGRAGFLRLAVQEVSGALT